MDHLYCPCPAAGCTNKTINYWYHAICGGKTQIRYADIQIICEKCNQSSILFDWKFSCQEHDFKPASLQGCLYALAILGQQKGNITQIQQATNALMSKWPKS